MAKAAYAFLTGRPYGIRLDFKRRGFALFNRNLNELGNDLPGSVDTLPLEKIRCGRIFRCAGSISSAGRI